MTMAGRPEVTTKVSTEKKLKHNIPHEIVQVALRYWLKRNFAEYRAFKDDELEFFFSEDGSVMAEGYKEGKKP